MTLAHYSAKPFRVVNLPYDQRPFSRKPEGLWVSVEGDGMYSWPEWCRENEWNVDNLAVRQEFRIVQPERIRTLATVDDLHAFTDEYQAELRGTPLEGIPGWDLTIQFIDWQRVARDYGGVLIAPYQWGAVQNLHLQWYPGWSCASGCVWDLRAIKQVPAT